MAKDEEVSPTGLILKTMAIATSDDGPRATSQQIHRVSTSDGTRKEGIGVEGLVRGDRPEGKEKGKRSTTAPLTPPKLLDNTDTKQVQGVQEKREEREYKEILELIGLVKQIEYKGPDPKLQQVIVNALGRVPIYIKTVRKCRKKDQARI